jgi:hypothetical protein
MATYEIHTIAEQPTATAEMTVPVAEISAWLAKAYGVGALVLAQHGEPVGDAREICYSDPSEEPDPMTWRTEIVQPYRAKRSAADP